MAVFIASSTFQIPSESGNPVQVAAGDLNRDGLSDLVVAWEVGVGTVDQPIQVLLNDGLGGFTSGASLVSGSLPTVAHPQQIILADLQGNGRPDIFVADHGYDASPFPGHQQKIMEWNGNGQLFDATSTVLPQELSFTHRAAVGDIDNNGTLDLFYANLPNATAPRPQLLVNNGAGSFALDQPALPTAVTQPGALGNTGVLLTELNGDGYADLVLGGWDPLHTGMHSSIVYLNDGHGSFASSNPITLPAPAIPLMSGIGPVALDIKSADLNRDGRPDIVIDWTNGDYTAHYYQILINQGGGVFADQTQQLLPQTIQNDYWTTHIYLVDLQNNGVFDLVSQPNGGVSPSAPTVYLNDGTGHLAAAGTFGNAGDIITPLNEGGRVDFVAIGGSGRGTIYNNNLLANTPDHGSIFRFFDSATGDHFYTLSAAEANQIRATLPTYHDEGSPWSTPAVGANTTDVFRFFDVATGNHFFTSSTAERDHVLATLPSYHFEGIAFEAYTAPGTDTLTLERFFNTQSHLHHYAASPAEIASIQSGGAGPGWVDEGAGFIVHI
jgi:Repeat of unknown function (DUF5648)/FG-GAP-like repeat